MVRSHLFHQLLIELQKEGLHPLVAFNYAETISDVIAENIISDDKLLQIELGKIASALIKIKSDY